MMAAIIVAAAVANATTIQKQNIKLVHSMLIKSMYSYDELLRIAFNIIWEQPCRKIYLT